MGEEIWKDIHEFEGIYQISSTGRVKSLARIDSLGHRRKEKLLSPKLNSDGYYAYALCKNGKMYYFLAHRLVAQVFIPNPDHKSCVDHINTNRTDNRVENLRWCTSQENQNNPLSIVKHRIASSKPVIQYTKDDYMLKVWDNATIAGEELGTYHQTISKCCKERYDYKTAGGYKWKYYDIETYLLGKLKNSMINKGYFKNKTA